MRLTYTRTVPPAQGAARTRSTDDPQHAEGGYFSVMLALLIIPLMIFAALAVDLGFWYTRSMELQRAADASALAGVVWMPNDFGRAQSTAVTTATRNSLPPGTGDVTVDVQRVPGQSRQLDVTITDPHVRTFFGAVLFDEISLTRTARARYVLPVPLGSPLSTFGNQNLTPTASDPKLWAAINGPYEKHASGDAFAVKCSGDPATVSTCPAGALNTDYRSEGYRYIVEVPAGAAGRTLTVRTLDGRFANRNDLQFETGDAFPGPTQPSGNTSNRMALQYELFEADATSFDITDNPTLNGRCSSGSGRRTLANNHSETPDGWVTLCSHTVSNVGEYVLTVKSSDIAGQTDQGTGTNQYSIAATLSGTGPQPRVYAYGDMSVMTNYTGSAGTRANNYLAEVESLHAGKKLSIELFDAGDGANGQFDLSILAPDGSIPTCKWNSPSSTTLDQQGPCTIRTRNNGTSSANNLYNDRWLRIEIQLPTTYSCNESGSTPVNAGPGVSAACWWRLSYLFGGTSPTPTDRTTWKAKLIGDPVQLIR